MDQKRLAALLRKLNKSAITPFGRIPLERLVAKNLDDLSILRSSGITWASLARALVDWRPDNDRPLSVDHLRSAYSRARRHKPPHIKSTRQATVGPDPQDLERSAPASREPQTTLSATENLTATGHPSNLRERLSRTANLRNIEED